MAIIDQDFLDGLLQQAAKNPRRRQNYDMRTTVSDTSQRMLNALLPDTEVPVHKHDDTAESVFCLRGKVDEVLYDDRQNEIARHRLCPAEGVYGLQIPAGVWHTVQVLEPSVLFEAKDGPFVPR